MHYKSQLNAKTPGKHNNAPAAATRNGRDGRCTGVSRRPWYSTPEAQFSKLLKKILRRS